MGLRDWMKKIFGKMFGTKTLESGNPPPITSAEPSFRSVMDELKVTGLDEIAKLKFSEIEAEYKSTLVEMAEKYKNTILSDATLQKIREDEIKTGKIGETPFICTVEVDDSGNFKTTVIVTDKSCSKITEDKNGNLTYQETRLDGEEMKTVVNTKNTSMIITGNVSQDEIDKIKNFNEKNKAGLATLKQFESDESNKKYIKALEQIGVRTDIDLKKTDDFMTSFAGKITRDENGKMQKIEEMTLVLDRKNKNKDPLVIAFNTTEKGKRIEKKFRLTEDGTYIDEDSATIDEETGQLKYKAYDLESIKDFAREKGIDDKVIDKAKKINRENVQLVPPVAKALHEKVKTEFEKEKAAKENPEQENNSPHPDEVFKEDVQPTGEKKEEYDDGSR